MIDSDTAKVDANAKVHPPDASDASEIKTSRIDVKRGIGKLCTVAIALSQYVPLIQQDLYDFKSYGEVLDTGKFDAKKEAKKRGNKSRRKTKIRRDIDM